LQKYLFFLPNLIHIFLLFTILLVKKAREDLIDRKLLLFLLLFLVMLEFCLRKAPEPGFPALFHFSIGVTVELGGEVYFLVFSNGKILVDDFEEIPEFVWDVGCWVCAF